MKTHLKESSILARRFGTEHGFNRILFFKRWNNLDVYVAEKDLDMVFIGYPTFIIIEEKNARFVSTSETPKILGISPGKNKNYDGEILP